MGAPRALRGPAVLQEEPQFRLLFAGQALSVVGDRLSFIAMPFAVLASGGGLGEVGLVAAATSLPFLLFSLVAGVVADRHDRRRIMIASDAVRLVAQVLAGGLVLAGLAEWWHLALIAFAYGSADAFFAPAMYGLMPQVVRPANLQSANALRGLSNAVAMVGGPALAGLLLTLLNPGGALLADAATFAVSIAFLARMRPGVPEAADPVEAGLLQGLKGGWREVRSRTWVWSMLLGLASYHAIVLPSVFALGPVLAARDLGGPGAWALITGGFGVGSILGQLVLLRWRPARPLRASAACLVFASMQAGIIGSGLPVVAIALLEALAAMAVQAYFTLWETSIQEQIPPGAVSRVGSYDYFAAMGMLPLGTALTSAIGDAVGLRPTLIGMSVLGVAAALAVLSVPSVRHLRRPAVPL